MASFGLSDRPHPQGGVDPFGHKAVDPIIEDHVMSSAEFDARNSGKRGAIINRAKVVAAQTRKRPERPAGHPGAQVRLSDFLDRIADRS